MKTIKLKEPVLIPANGHGQAKHGKAGQIVEVEDALADSLIARKLAVDPAAKADKGDKPDKGDKK